VKQSGLYLFTVQQFRDERAAQEDGEGSQPDQTTKRYFNSTL
jgi:hypothetical protein